MYDKFRLNFIIIPYREGKLGQKYIPPILREQPLRIYDYNINYIDQFINNNELSSFIKKINVNFRSLKEYRKLILFLLNNPKYINITFNNILNDNSDVSLFILFNYHIIKSNELIYKKMIYYFCSLYNDDDKIANILCLLLLNKKINDNGFFIEKSSYDIRTFKFKLNEIKSNSGTSTFYDQIIKSNILDESPLYLIIKYNKYLINATYINENIMIYNNIEYNIITDKPTPMDIRTVSKIPQLINKGLKNFFINFFNKSLNGIYLYGSKEDIHRLLIINKSNILEFDINILSSTIDRPSIKFKVNDIYFNLNKILKFDEYKHLPFTYLIPDNHIHLIYNEYNIYKVIFFINGNNSLFSIMMDVEKINELLHCHKIDSGIQIYEINNNNLMFPQLNSDFKKYSELCLNFGVNKYNILFINEYKNKEIKYAYNLNDKLFKLINFNKKRFLKKKLNVDELILNKISLLKKDENNLIKFTQDDKNRVIVKLKDKGYSIDKILFKINKCVINNTDVEKYKVEFQNIIDDINCNMMDDINFINNYGLNELLTC